MKLRIICDSVRLRLSSDEVARFAAAGRLEDAVHFPGATLAYGLEASDSVQSPEAAFSNGRLTVLLPRKDVQQWAAGDAIGISANDAAPAILVEKDLGCRE